MTNLRLQGGPRIRLLVFAEAITLAHVARPLALAQALDPDRYEIILACDRRYARFVEGHAWRGVEIATIPSAQFLAALARGWPVYDLATLESYVVADMRWIDIIRPHLIVGDFRLSLSVSARRAGVPYIAISNAYWSPFFRGVFPLPVLPWTRRVPLPLASKLFSIFRPFVFAVHCRPMNRLRARHGLPGLGNDLRRVYTDADHLLIADIAALLPIEPLPHWHTYIGPLCWSPSVSEPDWWQSLDASVPCVYVTLGSSGPHELLAVVLESLASLPVQVIASTAGATIPSKIPANARVADYLSGHDCAKRARLVVCNGGSLTVQQALQAGVPVLGLASNMDQFMNMAAVEAAGAGRVLRADRLDVASIRETCRTMLASRFLDEGASRVRSAIAVQKSVAAVFDEVADNLLGLGQAIALARPPVVQN